MNRLILPKLIYYSKLKKELNNNKKYSSQLKNQLKQIEKKIEI